MQHWVLGMTWLWPVVAAGLIGIALSFQPVINGASASVLNSAFAAATFSLLLSAATVFVLFCLSGAPTQASQLLQLPWWAVFGGFIGAVFVSGGIFLVPIMGAAVFFVCLIAGQLVGAVVADTIGAFGLEPRALSARKLAGVGLAFAGVVLVRWG
ncbi:MAG: transporter family-2 protein [Paracoccaceae bacterium]|jgi:transporter family-2 protein